MQTKDERVTKLAIELAALARKHPITHEAFDALDVAKILFRPSLPPRVNCLDMMESPSGSATDAQSHQAA